MGREKDKLKDMEEKIREQLTKQQSKVGEKMLEGRTASTVKDKAGTIIATEVTVFDIDDESMIWSDSAFYVFYCRLSGTQFMFSKAQFEPKTPPVPA